MIPGTDSVITECIALLVIVNLVYIARMVSRRILLGDFLKYRIDDWLMTFNIIAFNLVIAAIWLTCLLGNNYVYPEDVVDWTPADFEAAIKGSKWGVVMETFKVTGVWGCKACLLILYWSMTKGLPKYRKAVYWVAGYVALGYVVVMIGFFAIWCRPFHMYYDTIPVPEEHSECMTYRKHMLMDAAFNITSDALMLCLPIPLVIRAKVPMKRKMVLVGVFSLGALVILCAILNRITNFTADFGDYVYLNWYAGEIATAVVVANIPHMWPLISRVFGLGAFKASTGPSGSNSYPLRSKGAVVTIPSARRTKHDMNGYIPTDSEEKIADSGAKHTQWGYGKGNGSQSTNEDLEVGHMTTKIHAGEHGAPTSTDGQDTRLGGWENDNGNSGIKGGHIVKTVDINQTHSDYSP